MHPLLGLKQELRPLAVKAAQASPLPGSAHVAVKPGPSCTLDRMVSEPKIAGETYLGKKCTTAGRSRIIQFSCVQYPWSMWEDKKVTVIRY